MAKLYLEDSITPPMAIVQNDGDGAPAGFTETTDPIDWDIYGPALVGDDDLMHFSDLREEISVDYAALGGPSTAQKEVASRWFVVDESVRDVEYSAAEQEAHAKILLGLYSKDNLSRKEKSLVALIKDADKAAIDSIMSGYESINEETLIVAMGDEVTDIEVGDGKVTIHAPCSLYLKDIILSLTSQSSSGVVTVDIELNAVTIFTTKATIDANEDTSGTAATPYVFDATKQTLVKGDKLVFNIDGAGTGAQGLKATLLIQRIDN